MALTDEARENLLKYVERLFDEWALTLAFRAEVLDPKFKYRKVVEFRDRLIWTLWTRCWQAKRSPPGFLVDQEGLMYPAEWQPLSHPNIAAVLRLNHSTVTRSLKRTREKREAEQDESEVKRWDKAFAQIAENEKRRVHSFVDAHKVEFRHDAT